MLIDLTPSLACYVVGAEHIIEFANPAFRRFLCKDYPARTSLASVWSALRSALDDVYESGCTRTREEVPLATGARDVEEPATRYATLQLVPMLDPAGDVEGVLVSGTDVTSQVLARKEVERSNRRLLALAETSQQVLWRSDSQGSIEGVGAAWTHFTGLSQEASLGWQWTRVLHPDDLPRVVSFWKSHIEHPEELETSYRVRRHDGVYHRFDVRAVPVFDSEGRHVEWIGTCTDVEESHAAREERRRSRMELSLALEASGMGNWSRDAGSDEIQLSPRAAEILGLPADRSVVSREVIARIIHEEDRFSFWREMDRAEHDGSRFSLQYRIRRPDGAVRWIHSLGLVEPCVSPGLPRLVGTVADITDQKSYEAELIVAREAAEEMSRLKDAFLANMSHEIRTPLTSIIGYADVLQMESPDELREMAGFIRSNGERLLATLNLVLELAQIESGLLDLHPDQFDLVEHVRTLAESFDDEVRSRGLRFDLHSDFRALPVMLDSGALTRVLSLLLSNAVKFTNEGSIALAIRSRFDHVEIDVCDTGIGIAPDAIPRLFNEFHQESAGLSRNYEGAGIGLSIASKLVRLMGGTISVRSVKNAGTTFTVRLPLDTCSVARSATAVPAPAMRLLAVEDREDARFLLDRMLDGHVRVTYATDAYQALNLLESHSFDLILMDIHLGDGPDGEQLLSMIRAMPGAADLPVIACTAYALPGDRERLLRMGFDGYLSKPFRQETLLDAVAAWSVANESSMPR